MLDIFLLLFSWRETTLLAGPMGLQENKVNDSSTVISIHIIACEGSREKTEKKFLQIRKIVDHEADEIFFFKKKFADRSDLEKQL